jgi:hypothetical protein
LASASDAVDGAISRDLDNVAVASSYDEKDTGLIAGRGRCCRNNLNKLKQLFFRIQRQRKKSAKIKFQSWPPLFKLSLSNEVPFI